MKKVAWFYFEDYIVRDEIFVVAEALKQIIASIRQWEDIRSDKITKVTTDKYGVVEHFEMEIVGINDEFLDEKIRIIYDKGEVTCYLIQEKP
ncbi:MAG: hypothetical protein DRO40_08900 [Thermoprotei archaeon]|nr:MAG: hypothetical protein DRO40_08900 [Thermoprotei archaeon]